MKRTKLVMETLEGDGQGHTKLEVFEALSKMSFSLDVGSLQDGLTAFNAGDDATALEKWRLLADQGDANAQALLGMIYKDGVGVIEDAAEAARWFRLAADQGDVNAQLSLGVMYKDGIGVLKDAAEAARWYRLAADQAAEAATRLEKRRLLADQGNADAQNSLGMMYKDGNGVIKDAAEAARWYRLAADQGNADAQFNLGVMYKDGTGVIQDAAEAVRWYRLAADQGNADAQFNLGWMYQTGNDVIEDGAEAVRWFRLAADQGNADAQYLLGETQADLSRENRFLLSTGSLRRPRSAKKAVVYICAFLLGAWLMSLAMGP